MKSLIFSFCFVFVLLLLGACMPIQQCPDEWIMNEEPCLYEDDENGEITGCDDPTREYYILDGERQEIVEFDKEWVDDNCVLDPTIVS
jgi:hypothetical protein